MPEMRIIDFPEGFKKVAEEMAYTYEAQIHGCAQTTLAPFLEILGIEGDNVLMAATFLSGGANRCLTCGAISAGLMVIGLKYGRRDLKQGREVPIASMGPAWELVDRFKREYGTTNCCELVGRDLSDPAEIEAFNASPEELEKCFQRVKKVAGWVAEIISE